ncbi:MAG: hypothetical protein M3Z56_03855 [Bacteroidota bacterium]|nr:hypothetical protein [Bacteroidota bacterium]
MDDAAIKKADADIPTVLYRVAQLQINNIARHSDAKNVFIKIRSLKDTISMVIYDDCTGINAEDLEFGRGFSIIQERVEAFGGTFTLKSSSEEKGFMLLVTI